MKMREEESNWFSKWEEELPSPDELMPLSQTLITPDLALAFDIRTPVSLLHNHHHSQAPSPPQLFHQQQQSCSAAAAAPPPGSQHHPNSSEFDSSSAELPGGGADEPARTLKRPRLVWTPQLHKRFVDAVAHLGIKNAVPKTIMQLMSVDGLTRENVASHLQKYRLYLKRMQGLNSGSGPGAGGGGGPGAGVGGGSGDPATDHLFASGPVPAHFLGPGGRSNSNSEHFMPYMAAALHHHHPNPHHQVQAQYQRQQMGHHHFEQNPFLSRQAQAQAQAQAQLGVSRNGYNHNNVEDVESGTANNGGGGGRKVLTLFPTGDD